MQRGFQLPGCQDGVVPWVFRVQLSSGSCLGWRVPELAGRSLAGSPSAAKIPTPSTEGTIWEGAGDWFQG